MCQNFKVYLVDVVGFGKSDLPEHPLNSNDFGDFLKEFLEKLNSYVDTYNQGDKASSNGKDLINWTFSKETGYPILNFE